MKNCPNKTQIIRKKRKYHHLILRALCILLLSWQPMLAHATTSLTVVLTGLTGAPLDNARAALDAEKARLLAQQGTPASQKEPILSAKNRNAFYHAAPALIQTAIQPFGYFHAVIHPQGLTYQKNTWQAAFRILPGRPLPISKVTITLKGPGKTNISLQKYVQQFPLTVGATFNTPDYEKARDGLLQTANQQGYIKATFVKKEVKIDLKQYTAVITLQLTTGERYYFGPVTFNQTPFAPSFLQRFISFHEGEPFSSQKLQTLQTNLSESHYFRDVNVIPDIEHAQQQSVPIHVSLNVPKAKAYTAGVGYGTFTGARATLGADYRRIGRYGQHFSMQMRLSSVLSGLSGKYYIPGKNPLTEQFILGAEAQKFKPDNGQSTSQQFSAGWMKKVSDIQHAFTLTYLIEHFEVENTPSEFSRLLYPGYTVSWLKSDNLLNPTNAKALQLTVQGASEHFASYVNFFQTELKGKYIFSPTEASRIILRGDAGYTVVKDLTKLPLTLRFFAGGLTSVRGYADSSIGPGRYLETASVEYQHRLFGNLSGALFYDVGTATDHFNNYLFRGEGAGLIYHSMIGPIRVYVARAMSSRGKPLRTEFSIGPEF